MKPLHGFPWDGKPHIQSEKPWFPLDVPLNQSIDKYLITMIFPFYFSYIPSPPVNTLTQASCHWTQRRLDPVQVMDVQKVWYNKYICIYFDAFTYVHYMCLSICISICISMCISMCICLHAYTIHVHIHSPSYTIACQFPFGMSLHRNLLQPPHLPTPWVCLKN